MSTIKGVIPIAIIIFGFQLLVIRRRIPNLKKAIIGFGYVILGLALFLLGLEKALFPIGELDFAKAYQNGGHIEDARRHARKAIEIAGENVGNRARAWLYLAGLEQSQRNWDEAAKAYREAVELAFESSDALRAVSTRSVGF